MYFFFLPKCVKSLHGQITVKWYKTPEKVREFSFEEKKWNNTEYVKPIFNGYVEEKTLCLYFAIKKYFSFLF